MSREAQLNRAFVELADTLVNHFDVADLLHTLSSHCVELFDVDSAGLLLADGKGSLRVIASSTEQTRMLELLEVQGEEGPCLDCYHSGRAVIEEDLASAGRWPTFTPAALAAGFRAVEAVPLRLRDSVIGALNLFHREPGRLDDSDLGPVRRWPTWPRSASFRSGPSGRPACSPNSFRLRSTTGCSSSRPRGCWPSGPGWTWTLRSSFSAVTPEATISLSPRWPRPSSTAGSRLPDLQRVQS